jgi:putative transcriptional regulator
MLKDMSPVRLRLAEILREREMTQKELAALCGVSENAISKLVGSPRQIRLDTIDVICKALDLEPGDLIVRIEESRH